MSPHARPGAEIARCAFTLLSVATLLCAPIGGPEARAGSPAHEGGGVTPSPGRREARTGQAAADPETERGSRFLALSVLGSAVRIERNWDSGFGGELIFGGLTGSPALAAWAAAVDLIAYSERSGGRASLEGAIGTRWPTGLLFGLAGGPVAELDDFRKPRLGGQVSLWAFAAVVPFVRLGAVEKSGVFVDVGVRIPLPVWRW